MNKTMLKWVAAGVLAGVPAIGFARVHHVSAAAPLAAFSSTPILSSHPAAKLASIAPKKVVHTTAATAHKTVKKVVKHKVKPKLKHKVAPKIKSAKH